MRLSKGLWARVVGDVLDLGMLAAAFRSRESSPGRLAAGTAAVAGVTVLDVLAARKTTGDFLGIAPA